MINSDLRTDLKQQVTLALNLMSLSDKRRLIVLGTAQSLIGLLDLVGIVFLGALSSVVINGISSRIYGDRLSQFLDLVNLEDKEFNYQVLFLAGSAVLAIFSRIVLSIILARRILTFLSIRAAQVSVKLFQRVIDEGLDFLKRRTALRSQFAINRGVDLLIVGCLGIIVTLLADAVSLVMIFAGLLVIDFSFAIVLVLVFATLGAILHLVLKKRNEEIARLKTTYEIASNQKIQDTILTFREVHVRNQASQVLGDFSYLRVSSAKAIADSMFLPSIPKFVFESTVIAVAVFMGLFQLLTSDLFRAISTITIFLAAGMRVGPAMLRIQQGIMSLKSNLGQISPTLEILYDLGIKDLESFQTESNISEENSKRFKTKKLVDFQNVNFERTDTPKFKLNNLNFSIQEGEFVAIAGRSGSGKSTLIDLMLGLLEPTSGDIWIKGEQPRIAIKKFKSEVSYIPQDVHIFSGSIRENVQIGKADNKATESEIWQVLAKVDLESHVKSLSKGLDSQAGEFGNVLSGGQKQRIGIARALISNPKLLVMDESTSSLDSETEKSIIELLKNLRPKITIVAIAHRLSTFVNADRIIFLSEGRIKSEGTLEEIMRKNVEFRKQIAVLRRTH